MGRPVSDGLGLATPHDRQRDVPAASGQVAPFRHGGSTHCDPFIVPPIIDRQICAFDRVRV
jgi:hypothetical protein